MTATTRSSGARTAAVAGLIAAAVGILVLRFSGATMPAVLIALFELIGYLASESTYGLFAVDSPGILVGTWVRGIGIVVALVAGVATVIRSCSPSTVR